jgi:hypothetical protein
MSSENKWRYLRSVDSEFENRVFECVKAICQFSIINDEVDVEEYVDSVCGVMSSLTDECFIDTDTRRLVKDIVYLMKELYKKSEKKYDYDDYFQIHEFLSENVSCDELLDDVYSMNGKLSQNFQSVLV